MLSKSHSTAAGAQGNFSGHKKKKAPPRPPPPASGNIRTSQSFRTAGELQSQKIGAFGQRPSQSVDNSGKSGLSDLIDLATPPDSPERTRKTFSTSKSKEPADYMYRVGASVFYVKSQLKNPSASNQAANPFSPPRPSAQAMLASPAKHAVVAPQQQSSTLYSNVPAQQSQFASSQTTTTTMGSTKYNPTIIKRPTENNNTIRSAIEGNNNGKFGGGGSLRSSSGSSDWSDFSQTSQPQQQESQKCGNIPMTWDEPPALNREPVKASTVVVPTIIKPPTLIKPSLLPKPALGGTIANRVSPVATTLPHTELNVVQRNFYDDPPDSDFDDDEDLDDSYVSPPMPDEPPPPPPPDVVDWEDTSNNTLATTTFTESTYVHHHGTDTNRAYAIALYDYLPDVDGDLPLQAGDLVYLIKQIDDAWLYGKCAGVEGMFPSNYVNVVVPLSEAEEEDNANQPLQQQVSKPSSRPSSINYYFADALYKFDAEADGDINLRPGDMVKIFGRLNDDWLYGEVAGLVGQFPAAFVEPVPAELPIIPTGS